MYGPGLVRHGDRVFPQRSVLCVFDIWKSPRPIYIAFLWCLWTDAILRLKQGTKSGEFRKTGKQPGSDLSYGHNTDFHKIKPVFNSAKRQSWVWVWAWRAIYIGVSTAKPCDVTPASLKPTTLGGGKNFGRRTIEEMNISGEHPPLVAGHCDRQPRTGQFTWKIKKKRGHKVSFQDIQ